MTTDRIEPALTAEEWHIATLWHAGKMVGGKVRGQVVLSLTDEHRRAAAALALYGQPFGFSQEDVEDEQMIAEFFAGRADEAASYGLAGDERDQRSKAERFAARAAKIAALLPPAVQPLPTLADGIAAIAVLNAALPDSDPRKITREKIALLRAFLPSTANDRQHELSEFNAAESFLAALASYLPPE